MTGVNILPPTEMKKTILLAGDDISRHLRKGIKQNIEWGKEWQNIAIHRGAYTLRGIRILLPPLRTTASDILGTISLRSYLLPISHSLSS
jgi:hypothetical protein